MQRELAEVVVVAYGRSAIARAVKGALRNTHPIEYAAQVLNGVLDKVPQLPKKDIEDIIVGCAKPELKQRQNIARLIALRAELPYSVPAQTVNRFCASGLQTISTGANMIMTHQAEAIVTGGVESMTTVPYMGIGDPAFKDQWLDENEVGAYISMGLTAENVAERYQVTRKEMEEFAMGSHQKAAIAQDNGILAEDIIPVDAVNDDGSTFQFIRDECIRPNTTLESLSSLKPCFRENGLVTAGTSSPINDGASFVVMMSRKKADELGIRPIAKFLAYAVAGVDPRYMGIGPIQAVPKAMRLTGLSVSDMDVIELNEAFAAQSIPCIRKLGLDPKKVNPNGGAIALGHPLGASGTILTCKALSELKRQAGRYALVTMCIGGGMGAAAVFEAAK